MVRRGMGILDTPKALLSRLPLIGSSNEPKDEPEEANEPEPVNREPQPDSDPDGSGSEAEQPAGGSEEDVSDITAPSIGPNTKIEKEDPEERLARHEQSDTDAMGLDKRREVIGGQYSPSKGRQLATYGAVIGVVVLIVGGLLFAVNKVDQPEESYPDEAPWAQQGAADREPPPLDFPVYGNPGPGD